MSLIKSFFQLPDNPLVSIAMDPVVAHTLFKILSILSYKTKKVIQFGHSSVGELVIDIGPQKHIKEQHTPISM